MTSSIQLQIDNIRPDVIINICQNNNGLVRIKQSSFKESVDNSLALFVVLIMGITGFMTYCVVIFLVNIPDFKELSNYNKTIYILGIISIIVFCIFGMKRIMRCY